MSRHQTAGQSNYIRVANRSIEKVAKFKYLGATKRTRIAFRRKLGAD
jgi:hypothetical protein